MSCLGYYKAERYRIHPNVQVLGYDDVPEDTNKKLQGKYCLNLALISLYAHSPMSMGVLKMIMKYDKELFAAYNNSLMAEDLASKDVEKELAPTGNY